MKRLVVATSLLVFVLYIVFVHRARSLPESVKKEGISVVEKVRRVNIQSYRSYNPGVIALSDRYLIAVREKSNTFIEAIKLKLLNRQKNVIKITEIDKNFNQIGDLVEIIPAKHERFSKVTDPRLFKHNDQIYIIFSDHTQGGSVQTLAKIIKENGVWEAKDIIPLSFSDADQFYNAGVVSRGIEKNWMPFSFDGDIYFIYSLEPEVVVVKLDISNGNCQLVSKTENSLLDKFSPLRGGSPLIFDKRLGEFICLYHIAFPGYHRCTNIVKKVYIGGACTFSENFPFKMESKSLAPFFSESLYKNNRKKIIFPTALIEEGEHYLMFYGEDDHKTNVAIINRDQLISSLKRRGSENN